VAVRIWAVREPPLQVCGDAETARTVAISAALRARYKLTGLAVLCGVDADLAVAFVAGLVELLRVGV
jgi:hypothetical protein